MTETPGPAPHADNPIVQAVAPGYAFEETSLELGGLMLDAETLTDTHIRIPLAMLNRHGLVAGATGTGKTKTLQLLAEQLSANGVPVFAADMKGDLSGLAQPAPADDERITSRVAELGVEWAPAAAPVSFLSLGGLGPGVPVRATVSAFGPQLLAKVLDANETQTSTLSLVFHHADEQGLALLSRNELGQPMPEQLLGRPLEARAERGVDERQRRIGQIAADALRLRVEHLAGPLPAL